MPDYKSIAIVADEGKKVQSAYKKMKRKYKLTDVNEDTDLIIALGGDGFMLHILHDYMHLNIPIYGMNYGTIGFLMNEFDTKTNLRERIKKAKLEYLHPLHMTATQRDGTIHKALAINEVSLLRQTSQAANIRVKIDKKTRLSKLVCDGILVSTPAGSTAYNLSVHGPVVPLGSGIMPLTPISPFRPRRWRGALLPHKAEINYKIIDPAKRPVSATADYTEIRDVVEVTVKEDPRRILKLLFDKGHSLEDRIIGEQFIG